MPTQAPCPPPRVVTVVPTSRCFLDFVSTRQLQLAVARCPFPSLTCHIPHPVSPGGCHTVPPARGLNTGIRPLKILEAGSPKSRWQQVGPSEGAGSQAASAPLQLGGQFSACRPAGASPQLCLHPHTAVSPRVHPSMCIQVPIFTRTGPHQTRPTLVTSSSPGHLQTPIAK